MTSPVFLAREESIYDNQQLVFTSGINQLTFSVNRFEFENIGYVKRYEPSVLPTTENTAYSGVTLRQSGNVTIKMQFEFNLILTQARWSELLRIIEYQRQAYSKNNGRDSIETSVILKDNRIASYEGLNSLYIRPEEPTTPVLTFDPVNALLYPGWYWSTYRIIFTNYFTETYGQNKLRVNITAVESIVPTDTNGVNVPNQSLGQSVSTLVQADYNNITSTILGGALGGGWPTLDVVYVYSDGFGVGDRPYHLTLLYYTPIGSRTTGYCELVINQASNTDLVVRYPIPGMTDLDQFVGPERVFFTKESDTTALFYAPLQSGAKLYRLSNLDLGRVTFTEIALSGIPPSIGTNPYTYGFIDSSGDYYLVESSTLVINGSVNRLSFKYDSGIDSVTEVITSSPVSDQYFFYDSFRDNLLRVFRSSNLDTLEIVNVVGQPNTPLDNIYLRAGTIKPPGGAIFASSIQAANVRFGIESLNGDLYSSYLTEKFQVEDGLDTYDTLVSSSTVTSIPGQISPYVTHNNDQSIFAFGRIHICASMQPDLNPNSVECGFLDNDATDPAIITNIQDIFYPNLAPIGGYILSNTQYIYCLDVLSRTEVYLIRMVPFT